MSVQHIADPATFIRSLGELHDVTISRVTYDAGQNSVELATPDLNWNFERQPGYVERPCRIVLTRVLAFGISAGQDKFHTSLVSEGARIAHAYAISKESVSRMDIVMSTSEQWHVEFGDMAIHDKTDT